MPQPPLTADEPLLKQILQSDWDSLAPILQTHYSLAPFTDRQLRVTGQMDSVTHSARATIIIPFTTIAGALIPYQGTDIPVDVVHHTQIDRPDVFWRRTFHFPDKKPFVFKSRIVMSGDHEIIEYVRFGFGIRFKLSVQDGGLIQHDRGYVWTIGRRSIPLPMNLLLGKTVVEERPLSDSTFAMKMEIRHPLLGQTFQYNGTFSIHKSANH
jgi:hypothetical protein